MIHFLISGHINFQYDFINASFVPRQANPLWELVEAEVSQEGQQIEMLLPSVLSAMPRGNVSYTAHPTSELY